MADKEFSEAELAVFFEDAKAEQSHEVPACLTERVLADAAEIGAEYGAPDLIASVAKPKWTSRFFAPVGGMGGAFALAAFASLGLVVGLAETENLYSLPVMSDILAIFSDDISGATPFDTLEFLMTES